MSQYFDICENVARKAAEYCALVKQRRETCYDDRVLAAEWLDIVHKSEEAKTKLELAVEEYLAYLA